MLQWTKYVCLYFQEATADDEVEFEEDELEAEHAEQA